MNFRNLLIAAAVMFSLAGAVSAGGPLKKLFGGGRSHCDASCDHCPCSPTVEEVVVKKPCFKVECEQICVPKVRFPWPWLDRGARCQGKARGCGKGHGGPHGCSGTRCGHVKTVRVLTVDEYESVECRCNWDAGVKGCCGGKKAPMARPSVPPPGGEINGGEMNGGETNADEIPPPPNPQASGPAALIHRSRVR